MATYDQLREFQVFLASPSDVKVERGLAARVIEDVNEIVRPEGWCVRLIVWEDIPPGFGRPQDLINRYADQCQLFVGMLWRRWGSKPAASSVFSSGFEEEYSRALKSRETAGSPEIWMYFREIDSAFMEDPPRGVQRVQRFRKKFEKSFIGKHHTFREPEEWAAKFLRHLLAHLFRVIRENRGESSQLVQQSSSPTTPQPTTELNSGISAEATDIVSRVANALSLPDGEQTLTRVEKARFALVSAHVAGEFSDQNVLHAHEANLLYLHREELVLGWKELRTLVRTGISGYFNQNVPLWFWLRDRNAGRILGKIALHEPNEQMRSNALQAMADFAVVPDDEARSVSEILAIFFEEGTSKDIRLSACKLVAAIGSSANAGVLEREVARNDVATRSEAEKALFKIRSRTSLVEAIQAGISGQLAIDLAPSDGNALSLLNADVLLAGLQHKDATIRRDCARELRMRGAMTEATASLALEDSALLVRKESIIAKMDAGEAFDRDALSKLMTRSEHSGAFGASARGFADVDTDALGELLLLQLAKLPTSTLKERLSWYGLDSELHYWSLTQRQDGVSLEQIRRDVSDGFAAFRQWSFEKLEAAVGTVTAQHLKDAWDKYDTSINARLTAAAVRAIALRYDAGDLELVRKFVRADKYAFPAAALRDVANYLGSHGDASDVPTLLGLSQSAGLLAPSLFPDDAAITDAVVKLCSKHLPEVLQDASTSFWHDKVIVALPDQVIADLPDESKWALLQAEDASTRAAFAKRWFASLTEMELTSLISRYTSGRYYYNVVYWADAFVYRANTAKRLSDEYSN